MRVSNANAPVSKRMLKVIAFVLLAWYLGGPLTELVDRWDDFRADVADIACSTGGRLTLIVMGAAIALGLARTLRQRYSSLARNIQHRVVCPVFGVSDVRAIEVSPSESPPPLPVPLRV